MGNADYKTASGGSGSRSRTNLKRKVIDLTDQNPSEVRPSTPKKSKATSKDKQPPSEKRLRRYRPKPPQSFLEIHHRAMTQRMTILDRSRFHSTETNVPEETVKIAGTTGNVYTVVIGLVPTCDCPHARKGNQCKHIIYVMSRALKARWELQYQLSFVTEELEEMFNNAPLPTQACDSNADTENDGRRKPIAEGDDCPICCVEFDNSSPEEIVYCKAACGNNVHRSCFDTWAMQKRRSGNGAVTCPFCRTPWQEDEDVRAVTKRIKSGAGNVGDEGYVNVARELGLSGRRDYSTYHSYWVNRQRNQGLIPDED